MTFKRVLMPLFVLGIVCIMGSAAYAQTAINCGLTITPTAAGGGGTSTPRATATGLTEPIGAGTSTALGGVTPTAPGGGGVRVTCYNNGAVGTPIDPGVVALTISLGVPITNNTSTTVAGALVAGLPSNAARIRVANFAGDFAATNACINLVNNAAGIIVIGLGTTTCNNANDNRTGSPTIGINFTAGPFTSSFDLQGVLVSTNGRTTPVVAQMTSSGGITVGPVGPTAGGLAVGAASIPVIDSILAGLQDPTVPSSIPPGSSNAFFANVTAGPAVLSSNGLPVGGKNNFVLKIQENYVDMFRDAAQFNGSGAALTGVFPPSGSSDTQLQISLNNLPSGLDVSGCSATITNTAGTGTNPGTTGTAQANFTNITAASPIVTVNFNGPLDLEAIDVVWIKCVTVTLGTATTPLPSTPVTAQVTMAPTGTALSATGGAQTGLTTGNIPRYNQALQPATPGVTIILFPPANTVMLLTFGFVGPGYNTGVAVANTTVDPYGTASGGAAPSAGTISFLFVKNDGTTKTYTTTTGSPGSGLTGAGVVASGSTYVVNLSELLSAANFGTTFTGYVFITANFTYGHGAATIYTTSTGAAALSSPVLVLPAVSTAVPRPTPDVGAGLGQ